MASMYGMEKKKDLGFGIWVQNEKTNKFRGEMNWEDKNKVVGFFSRNSSEHDCERKGLGHLSYSVLWWGVEFSFSYFSFLFFLFLD